MLPFDGNPGFDKFQMLIWAFSTDKVTLFVGNPHLEFTVQQAGLNASPILAHLKSFHEGIGYYVMSPVLSSLLAKDFKPVAQYLDHKEYYPNLLDENTNHARLEDIYEYGQRIQEILRCGMIYSVAHQVELPGLQSLSFRKLKSLQPYPPMEFLSVIGLIFRDGISEVEGLRRFVVLYLAEHFDEIMTKETRRMLDFLKDHAGLARDMFRELGQLPNLTPDIAPKADKEVEEEGKLVEQSDEDGASCHVYEEA